MLHAPIDLRSDTVTRPVPAMREAMAAAEVGDDVYGEDPTVRRLQERAAELLGKEAALFVPSGTMANQVALLVHCERGDEVLVGEGAHCMLYESGAGSAFAGVGFATVGRGGLYTAEELAATIKPDEYHFPRSRLVALENTHNRAGGRVFPQDEVVRIAALAHARGLPVHLDGARIWNAAVATGLSPAELAAPADTVSACFSKGLGAPVGSVLVGPPALIERAHRFRKMLGGGMRQVGVIAAGALYALEHHRERLVEDHDRAARLARGLSTLPGVCCDEADVETNILNMELSRGDAASCVRALAGRGVLVNATGPRRIRWVTHLDVDTPAIDRAVETFAEVLEEGLA
ncbi:MAG: low-specificity L-threonine aldolase [Myxococcales bacterium]|jgi:threonine aldolase